MWMIWKNPDSDREVRETIYPTWDRCPTPGYEEMTTEQKAHCLLDYWNSTLRPHEEPRELIRIEESEGLTEEEKQKTVRLVVANVTTFAGMAMNAEHYYADLRAHPYRNVNEATHGIILERTLTQKEAMYLNKKDDAGFLSSSMGLKRGDTTMRFDTLDQVKKEAIKIFNQEFRNDFAVLVMPTLDSDHYQRFEVIAGNEKVMTAIGKCINTTEKIKTLEDYGFQTHMLN